jgi:hypothetical protein
MSSSLALESNLGSLELESTLRFTAGGWCCSNRRMKKHENAAILAIKIYLIPLWLLLYILPAFTDD